ncbi:hypothetical protein D9C73_000069 [Collichthys lucidus]|uniref:HECT domain-containing protein n=1 Tax=Collichthys lucidus TaxID=240159 RepID=A0A4U5TWW3_COLLU|nr:hypothetical protein D9C73_000069 [Collichthys lucidus]
MGMYHLVDRFDNFNRFIWMSSAQCRLYGPEFVVKYNKLHIDETVIPLMTDSDLAKYIPKVGDRVSTVAFCRQAALSQESPSRKESILSRLRQRLSGGEGMPPKKRSSKLEGNTNAKRKVRRLEVGWMDYDEDEERYKQVKSANGGGTRHLSVEKDETVADIKVMAENIFFPNGCSKKKIRLSNYSTHMESSQIHINVSNTVDELYNKSKLKMLRLYLCTKMKTGQQPPVGVEDDHTTSQPSEVDLTDQNQAVEYLLVENRNSESTYHHFINDGASTSGNLELDETLPWDGLLTLGEGEDSHAVIFVGEGRLDVTEDEPNLETAIPEKEDDAPSETVDQSLSPPVLAGEADVSAQALSEPQSSPVTLIVRRGHCLTDMINAFKDPKIVASERCCVTRRPVVFKDSLLLYVSHEERSILEKALEDFNSVDTDELLDVLDAHECKQVPTEDTLLPVLSQIGHKVIIQAPMYVIKCWRPVLVSVASLLPPEGLHHFIAQKKPTAKTVKALLKFPEEMTAAQSTVSRYLKRYIGEIDCKNLQLFLRFCTGSDVLDKAILIVFIETTNFLRRPQSHTCGCVLKLPIGYYSYPDFRSEFNNILTSSMWVMDVV